ncbi:hypothetical protein EDEG_01704 [Edhazardia aedis USNM 41457]|uniref:RDRP core domain-containing protein n=1 Tax=Edhazardia aedis (strain USNM 41457) TaxID=1003232 RepID=J9DN97_EDHAE|nr:hypothetical protein EDEG_01704 [Edhazardia aedis USNM 41457]|eukprot:EJW04010.1 hypothetical protein EDEG_01704 [Edhazardia aedis USNM 41457]
MKKTTYSVKNKYLIETCQCEKTEKTYTLPYDRDTNILFGSIVVAKNPCLHPGDVRIAEAVYKKELEHLQDVIVFSGKGSRPLFNMCSGSDLDGDQYAVIWDKRLIPTKTVDPDTYDNTTILMKEMVTLNDVINFYVRYMKEDELGLIATAHLATSDRLSIMDKECITLAKLFNKGVDFPKTGYVARLPDDLLPSSYPDFMQQNSQYKSDKILGKMYRRCKILSSVKYPRCVCKASVSEYFRYFIDLKCFRRDDDVSNVIESFIFDQTHSFIDDKYILNELLSTHVAGNNKFHVIKENKNNINTVDTNKGAGLSNNIDNIADSNSLSANNSVESATKNISNTTIFENMKYQNKQYNVYLHNTLLKNKSVYIENEALKKEKKLGKMNFLLKNTEDLQNTEENTTQLTKNVFNYDNLLENIKHGLDVNNKKRLKTATIKINKKSNKKIVKRVNIKAKNHEEHFNAVMQCFKGTEYLECFLNADIFDDKSKIKSKNNEIKPDNIENNINAIKQNLNLQLNSSTNINKQIDGFSGIKNANDSKNVINCIDDEIENSKSSNSCEENEKNKNNILVSIQSEDMKNENNGNIQSSDLSTGDESSSNIENKDITSANILVDIEKQNVTENAKTTAMKAIDSYMDLSTCDDSEIASTNSELSISNKIREKDVFIDYITENGNDVDDKTIFNKIIFSDSKNTIKKDDIYYCNAKIAQMSNVNEKHSSIISDEKHSNILDNTLHGIVNKKIKICIPTKIKIDKKQHEKNSSDEDSYISIQKEMKITDIVNKNILDITSNQESDISLSKSNLHILYDDKSNSNDKINNFYIKNCNNVLDKHIKNSKEAPMTPLSPKNVAEFFDLLKKILYKLKLGQRITTEEKNILYAFLGKNFISENIEEILVIKKIFAFMSFLSLKIAVKRLISKCYEENIQSAISQTHDIIYDIKKDKNLKSNHSLHKNYESINNECNSLCFKDESNLCLIHQKNYENIVEDMQSCDQSLNNIGKDRFDELETLKDTDSNVNKNFLNYKSSKKTLEKSESHSTSRNNEDSSDFQDNSSDSIKDNEKKQIKYKGKYELIDELPEDIFFIRKGVKRVQSFLASKEKTCGDVKTNLPKAFYEEINSRSKRKNYTCRKYTSSLYLKDRVSQMKKLRNLIKNSEVQRNNKICQFLEYFSTNKLVTKDILQKLWDKVKSYDEDTTIINNLYKQEIKSVIKKYGHKSEVDAILGFKDNTIQKSVIPMIKKITKKYKNRFYKSVPYDELIFKALSWYKIGHKECDEEFLSFAYINMEILKENWNVFEVFRKLIIADVDIVNMNNKLFEKILLTKLKSKVGNKNSATDDLNNIQEKKHVLELENNEGKNINDRRNANNNECVLKLGNKIKSIDQIDTNIMSSIKLDNNLESINQIDNNLISIRKLNENIESIDEIFNNLASINKLNNNLKFIHEIDSNITSINKLNNNLESIDKTDNNLTSIDKIDNNLTSISKWKNCIATQNIKENEKKNLEISNNESNILPKEQEMLFSKDSKHFLSEKTQNNENKSIITAETLQSNISHHKTEKSLSLLQSILAKDFAKVKDVENSDIRKKINMCDSNKNTGTKSVLKNDNGKSVSLVINLDKKVSTSDSNFSCENTKKTCSNTQSLKIENLKTSYEIDEVQHNDLLTILNSNNIGFLVFKLCKKIVFIESTKKEVVSDILNMQIKKTFVKHENFFLEFTLFEKYLFLKNYIYETKYILEIFNILLAIRFFSFEEPGYILEFVVAICKTLRMKFISPEKINKNFQKIVDDVSKQIKNNSEKFEAQQKGNKNYSYNLVNTNKNGNKNNNEKINLTANNKLEEKSESSKNIYKESTINENNNNEKMKDNTKFFSTDKISINLEFTKVSEENSVLLENKTTEFEIFEKISKEEIFYILELESLNDISQHHHQQVIVKFLNSVSTFSYKNNINELIDIQNLFQDITADNGKLTYFDFLRAINEKNNADQKTNIIIDKHPQDSIANNNTISEYRSNIKTSFDNINNSKKYEENTENTLFAENTNQVNINQWFAAEFNNWLLGDDKEARGNMLFTVSFIFASNHDFRKKVIAAEQTFINYKTALPYVKKNKIHLKANFKKIPCEICIVGMFDDQETVYMVPYKGIYHSFHTNFKKYTPKLNNPGKCPVNNYRESIRTFILSNIGYYKEKFGLNSFTIKISPGCLYFYNLNPIYTNNNISLEKISSKMTYSVADSNSKTANQESIFTQFINDHEYMDLDSLEDKLQSNIIKIDTKKTLYVLTISYKNTRYDVTYLEEDNSFSVIKIIKNRKILARYAIINDKSALFELQGEECLYDTTKNINILFNEENFYLEKLFEYFENTDTFKVSDKIKSPQDIRLEIFVILTLQNDKKYVNSQDEIVNNSKETDHSSEIIESFKIPSLDVVFKQIYTKNDTNGNLEKSRSEKNCYSTVSNVFDKMEYRPFEDFFDKTWNKYKTFFS